MPIATSAAYGVRAYPTLVVVGSDGKVVSYSHDVESADEVVRRLLAG